MGLSAPTVVRPEVPRYVSRPRDRETALLVPMQLSRILIRELTDFQMIELREIPINGTSEDTLRSFPIVIGLPEAQAIERRLKGIAVKRPQTHDLLASVVESLGAELVSVEINSIDDHTYYATLKLQACDGEIVDVDARPSDAIALGIASRVPILVEERVIESASDQA